MTHPRSEDERLVLLEAATTALAQSGVAASTAVIARNAGIVEGTLSRYLAIRDDLVNRLYLFLRQNLCQSVMANLDRSVADAKIMTRYIWNSYTNWGLNHICGHRTIRQLAVSEKISKETEQQANGMFPELRGLCHHSVRPEFMPDEYRALGNVLFLSLTEITMELAVRNTARANDYISTGFKAIWHALAHEKQ